MTIRFLTFAGSLYCATFPVVAQAQAAPESLAIIIETPSTEAIGCGVSESDIRATIRSSMRYNRIQEDAKSPVFVHITFQGYRATPAICVGSYSITIFEFGTAELGGTMRWTTNTFCEQSYLLSGPNLGQYREQMVQDFEACLSTMQDRIRL